MTTNRVIKASSKTLSVQDLRVDFLSDGVWHPAVRGISFDVKAGETVAIVGESGSGKSATALAVMQLLPHRGARATGRITLEGRDLLGLSEREMLGVRGDQISMIFQEPMTSLNPVLPIGVQISEVLNTHRGLSRRQAETETLALLKKVKISSAETRYHEYPHRFSGGMRQRVMIAMALACQPKLLIADEPTTALDVTTQAAILDLIRELQQETGMAVLFITHDLGVVAEVADRTVVMRHGEILENKDTATLFATPENDYTRLLLATVPDLPEMSPTPLRIPAQGPGDAAQPAGAPRPVPALEVRNLQAYFDIRSGTFGRVEGRVHAVENISFTIEAGKTLALVGESGSGKSTVAKSIVRLVDPTAGQVLVRGKDILKLDARELRRSRGSVQMVFQDPFASLNPRLSIGSLIAEPLLHHRIAGRKEVGEIVAGLLDHVGLDHRMAERYPHEMSGGQRQRVCIARAIALRPSVIVADEAVSALDVSVKVQIIDLIRRLQEEHGIAILFITHDISVIQRLGDRIAVMYLGEIVETGRTDDILRYPRHQYTRRLINAVPRIGPSNRRRPPTVVSEENASPVRPFGYKPVPRRYITVGADHYVMV